MKAWDVTTDGPDQTAALGTLVGEYCVPGMVLLLNGELGAGKTCFAQGVARGVGVSASTPVTSPSYTLLNVHQGRMPLYHFDLYRLSIVDDLADIGYDEFAESDGLTLVEWADRMLDGMDASLSITIKYDAEFRRKFSFAAFDLHGRELLGKLESFWCKGSENPPVSP